jgi:hypothetical protein
MDSVAFVLKNFRKINGQNLKRHFQQSMHAHTYSRRFVYRNGDHRGCRYYTPLVGWLAEATQNMAAGFWIVVGSFCIVACLAMVCSSRDARVRERSSLPSFFEIFVGWRDSAL